MTARYPKPDTVVGRVLGALLRREVITGKEIWLRLGSSRLSHHIWALRQDGWPIQAQRIEVVTSDNGRTAHIGEYWIHGADIIDADDQGRDYARLTHNIEQARKASREGK
jgi:hypothetical protein